MRVFCFFEAEKKKKGDSGNGEKYKVIDDRETRMRGNGNLQSTQASESLCRTARYPLLERNTVYNITP